MESLIRGTVLNEKYSIIDLLGRGAMGTVYLVEDVNNREKKYAVKELISDFPDQEKQEIAYKTFQTEIDFLSQLNHRQLPQIFETFNQWNIYYLVMEFIEGDSIETILERDKAPLPTDDVLDWAIQLTVVLEYFHNQPLGPVVYRDIKPPNIIITPTGTVTLVDLGIARRYESGKETDTMRFGTPGYAAPEQFKGRGQSSPKSDIYGLGVLIFQLLTGYDPTLTPFKFPPMKNLNSEIPEELEKIIKKAVHPNARERYENMRVFRDTLSIFSREKYKVKRTESSGGQIKRPLEKVDYPSFPVKKSWATRLSVSLMALVVTFLFTSGCMTIGMLGTFKSLFIIEGTLGIILWSGIIAALPAGIITYNLKEYF